MSGLPIQWVLWNAAGSMDNLWKKWEGHTVDGAFALRQLLSSTERSAVFLTDYTRQKDGRSAIKLIAADAQQADLLVSRWQSVSALSHPNLIRLLKTGISKLGNSP